MVDRSVADRLSSNSAFALDDQLEFATLGLDLLLRGEGFHRGAFNPFPVGY